MKHICDFCGGQSKAKLETMRVPRIVRNYFKIENNGIVIAAFPKSDMVKMQTYRMCPICMSRMAFLWPCIDADD